MAISKKGTENLQLSAVVQNSDDAIISLTLDGTINSWNKAARKMYGFTEAEVMGKHISILIGSEKITEEESILARIKEGRKVHHFETVRISKDGREIPVSLTISPIKDKEGKIIGASKIARDITLHKQASEKLAWLAAIVDSSTDAIVSKTLEGIIISWNTAARRMFGYTEKEAIGKHISMIIPAGRINEENIIISKIRNGDQIKHFETVRIAKDGRKVNISLTVSPIRGQKGKIVGASKIIRDITEQIKTSEKLKLYSKQLEQMNSYKDNFIGMASHELKTPLASINGYLQILERSIEGAQNKLFVKKAITQVAKLAALVSDLLDISKIQSGKLSLNCVKFDFNELLEEVTETIQQTTSSHVFELQIGSSVKINADRHRLEQVLINLLTNSTKYSPDAEKVIIKSAIKDNCVRVSVQDFGIGIPREEHDKIFSRFYRVEEPAHTFSGLGLGLYIANEIISMHKGKLWVESAPQRGSTFFFEIPVAGNP